MLFRDHCYITVCSSSISSSLEGNLPAPPLSSQPRARQHELFFPQQQFLTAVLEGPVCRVSRGHHKLVLALVAAREVGVVQQQVGAGDQRNGELAQTTRERLSASHEQPLRGDRGSYLQNATSAVSWGRSHPPPA